jgi:hypothetical protein
MEKKLSSQNELNLNKLCNEIFAGHNNASGGYTRPTGSVFKTPVLNLFKTKCEKNTWSKKSSVIYSKLIFHIFFKKRREC